MKPLRTLSRCIAFVRARIQLRKLPQNQLDILRIEIIPSNGCVSCDLLMRRVGLLDPTRAKLQTEQTLQDALTLRCLIFHTFLDTRTANLRVFRKSASGIHELVLAGTVQADCGDVPKGLSPAMQAKRCGFSFVLSDGVLRTLATEHLSQAC